MSGTKKRFGFVSNSSSSSFLIYGTNISNSKVEKLEESGFDIDSLEDVGLDIHRMDYETYIGRSWDSVGDDETGKQFKEKIQEKIKVHFPDAKFRTFEKAWYDG